MGLRFIVKGADYSGLGLGNVFTEADNFILRAGITDPTQKAAIYALYNSLVSSGVFQKAIAIYPFVGDTFDKHKWNLKNPVDSDAAGRLTVLSGSSSSAGFSGALNTHIAPINPADVSFGVFNLANPAVGSYSGGANKSDEVGIYLSRNNAANTTIASAANYDTDGKITVNPADVAKAGFLLVTRTSANLSKLYDDGAVIGTKTTAATIFNTTGTNPLYLGKLNYNNGTTVGTAVTINFAFIGSGLTDVQAAALNTAIVAFNTAIGR